MASPRDDLYRQMEIVIAAARGKVGLCAIHLHTRATIEHQADVPLPAMSAIKVVHLLELMCRVAGGTENLDERVPWNPPAGFRPGHGSGIIQFLRPGLNLTLWDWATLMTLASDNAATEFFWAHYGAAALDARTADLGVTTHFRDTPTSALGGPVTARDMANLLAEIGRPQRLDARAAGLCLDLLKYQQHVSHLPRYFPEYQYGGEIGKGFVCGCKPGYSGGTRTDVGVCFSPEADWAIAVLVNGSPPAPETTNPTDRPGAVAIGRLSRLIHDYFRGRPLTDVMALGPRA